MSGATPYFAAAKGEAVSKRFTDMNHGRAAVHWRNVDTVDIQNGRGNVWREYGGGLPDFSVDYLTKLYDLNRFTELHR